MSRTVEPPLTRGHKKKSRTRRQLLDAASAVLAEQGEAFTIDDVATRAGVAHGTFYNYFTDRDGLLDALVSYTVEEFAVLSAHAVEETDAAVRFARISARALSAAIEAPDVVRVALRLDAVQRALVLEGPLAYLHEDLVAGHRSGRFPEAVDEATIDVVFGALLLAARRVLDGDTDAAYRTAVIRRLLVALGIDRAEATDIATVAVADHR